MIEFPRCANCRVKVEPAQNLVFRQDGRVQHSDCPPVFCPVCDRSIAAHEPIRRDGDRLMHGNCWVKRYRTGLVT